MHGGRWRLGGAGQACCPLPLPCLQWALAPCAFSLGDGLCPPPSRGLGRAKRCRVLSAFVGFTPLHV